MFQLSKEEFDNLKSQIVISSWAGWEIKELFDFGGRFTLE